MPKKGTYAALQQLQPISTDFGKIARDNELLQFKYREEKKQKEDAEKQRKDKVTEGFNADYSTLQDVITGTQSIDEAYTRGLDSARELRFAIHKSAEKNPEIMGDPKTTFITANLRNFSATLAEAGKKYSEYAKTTATGIADGTLSSWNNDTLDELNSIFVEANLEVQADPETGHPIGLTTDKNGEIKRVNIIEILDGRGLIDTPAKYDFQAKTKEIGTKLGKDVISRQEGFTTIKEQNYSTKEGEVREVVKGLLGSPEEPSDIAKSIWTDAMGKKKSDYNAKSSLKEIEDFYVKGVGLYYSEELTRDPNLSAQASKDRLDFKKSQDAIGVDRATPEISIDTRTGTPEVREIEVEGNKIGEGYVVTFGGGSEIPLINTKTKIVSLKNFTVLPNGDMYADVLTQKKGETEAVIDEASGEIDLAASILQSDDWVVTTDANKKMTTTDFNNLARSKKIVKSDGTPFRNGKELKDYVDAKYNDASKVTEKKPEITDTSIYN